MPQPAWGTGRGTPATRSRHGNTVDHTGADRFSGYVLRNVNSGKCLEIDGRRVGNGVPGQQWDCWNGNNQIWYPLSPNR